MKTEELFVYGAWSPGYAQYPRLEPFVLSSRAATVRGRLYRTPLGFPIFTSEGSDIIQGEVLTLKAGAGLDRVFQEFPTLKVDCLSEGKLGSARIFATPREVLPHSSPKISRGDWRRDLERRPDLVSQLTSPQKRYLERLGASTSVGFDWDPHLYRELLRMGLIADRGVKPDLTDLGRELIRHLPSAEGLHH